MIDIQETKKVNNAMVEIMKQSLQIQLWRNQNEQNRNIVD